MCINSTLLFSPQIINKNYSESQSKVPQAPKLKTIQQEPVVRYGCFQRIVPQMQGKFL